MPRRPSPEVVLLLEAEELLIEGRSWFLRERLNERDGRFDTRELSAFCVERRLMCLVRDDGVQLLRGWRPMLDRLKRGDGDVFLLRQLNRHRPRSRGKIYAADLADFWSWVERTVASGDRVESWESTHRRPDPEWDDPWMNKIRRRECRRTGRMLRWFL